MKHYEIFYIIPLSVADEEISDVTSAVRKVLEEGGAGSLQENNLGKKKLMYPVKHQKHGTYVACEFDAEPSAVLEFDRKIRLMNNILRFLVVEKEVKTDEQIKREQAGRIWLQKRYRASQARKGFLGGEKESVESTKVKDLLKAHGVKETASATAAAVASAEKRETVAATEKESKVRLEELDKKLDKILEDDML